MKALIISSFEEEQKHIARLLEELETVEAVMQFRSFSKAVRFLEDNTTDLVLMDADSEEIYWTAQYRIIKTVDRNAKVVLMSGNDGNAVKAHETGAFDYLLKPVKRKQLERVIEKCSG